MIMRATLVFAPLLIMAAPAFAQAAPPAPTPEAALPEMQQVMADPATVDRLTSAMQALSKAFLDLPVGNVQAALEGRRPTPADRRRTVRSETGMNERDLSERIAAAKPKIEQGIRAMNQALPEITQDLRHAQQSVERAVANLPDPTY